MKKRRWRGRCLNESLHCFTDIFIIRRPFQASSIAVLIVTPHAGVPNDKGIVKRRADAALRIAVTVVCAAVVVVVVLVVVMIILLPKVHHVHRHGLLLPIVVVFSPPLLLLLRLGLFMLTSKIGSNTTTTANAAALPPRQGFAWVHGVLKGGAALEFAHHREGCDQCRISMNYQYLQKGSSQPQLSRGQPIAVCL